MSEFLITIAIPTYNNAKTIQSTIESCLDQDTDTEYEILVVNNASGDETKKILEQYDDKKLHVMHNNKTLSMYDNHNVCLNNARGKYILFCHSDDTLEKHAIETLVRKIKERNYPEKYVLWGHSMFRDFSSDVHRAGFLMKEMIVGEYAPSIFMHRGLTPSGTCYSRNSLLRIGGFLKTNHRLAPSDMTSMLYIALNGFRFEMMDEMIFIRKDASTATTRTKLQDKLDARDDAFIAFLQYTDKDTIEQLLSLSARPKVIPFSLYYALAQEPDYKLTIKKRLAKELIKHPLQIKNKIFPKLLKRLLF